jgi:hypothetical protein
MGVKQQLFIAVTEHLSQIAALFSGDMKFTFIARDPTNPEMDVLISDDDFEAVKALLDRRMGTEPEAAPTVRDYLGLPDVGEGSDPP